MFTATSRSKGTVVRADERCVPSLWRSAKLRSRHLRTGFVRARSLLWAADREAVAGFSVLRTRPVEAGDTSVRRKGCSSMGESLRRDANANKAPAAQFVQQTGLSPGRSPRTPPVRSIVSIRTFSLLIHVRPCRLKDHDWS